MNRGEKGKEGEIRRGELMVEKLIRGISGGKREGNSTPSPTWKFGLVQPDGSLIQGSNFSTSLSTLSARKLGANLWEMEPQLNHRVASINRNGPFLRNHRLEDKSFAIPKDLEAAPISPSRKETSDISFRKQLAAALARIDMDGQAQQPLNPASCSTSMETDPHRATVGPNSSVVLNDKYGVPSCSLKTSNELLKVLNRLWSLEEKHALDMSLVRTLRRELEESHAQAQLLMREKKRDQNEINHLSKQMAEYSVSRKREQQCINDAVKLVEDELKSRRHSEKRHHKLANELSQMKSSFSNVLRELDGERKARILLEDLCDEFAKGIRNYEHEVRLTRHRYCKDQIGKRDEGNDRLILHISEAWLDERAQMKLAEASDVSEQHSALDKLCVEIEAFLREKQSDHSGKNVATSFSKSPSRRHALPHSLESFHLNEPASAPWRVNDEEDDSIGTTNLRPHLSRGYSLKQTETAPKPGNQRVHSRRGSEPPSTSQIQLALEEQLNEKHLHHHHQQVKEGSRKSRNPNPNEASHPRRPRKGKTITEDTDADLYDARARSRLGQGQDSHRVDGSSFDPSTSEPHAKRCLNSSGMKPSTLKAKLIEARLELQQSRTSGKGLSKAEQRCNDL